MKMLFLSALALVSSCAVYSQDVYRVGWQENELTYFGSPFTSTSAEAETRVSAANQVDPHLTRFLMPDRGGLPAPGIAWEEMPSAALHRAYLASLLMVAGGNGMDIASSYGKRELNPLLKGANGTFDMSSVGRKAAIASALALPQLYLVRRSAHRMKALTVANFVVGVALMGVSAHNFGASAHH